MSKVQNGVQNECEASRVDPNTIKMDDEEGMEIVDAEGVPTSGYSAYGLRVTSPNHITKKEKHQC